jgi:lipopolysaccharide/colanic/teichoic acid biosynthesis glycosyltransferase
VEEVLPVKQKYYLEYVANRSMWTDLRILGATLAALVKRS